MESVELVIAAEEHFGISIPNDRLSRTATVGELHELIVKVLRENGRQPEPDVVFEELRVIVVHQLGVKPSEVVPSARFVDDLRMD